jgi:2'-5' RNA ligase
MRLFIAIDLDSAARETIAAEQRALARAIGDDRSLRWVRTDQMHLTLVFLGEVSDAGVPPLVAAIGAPLSTPTFDLGFAGFGVFPPRGAPRVLWLGVKTGASDAVEVQRDIADRVTGAGVEIDTRSFQPHLTLARWRTAPRGEIRRALERLPAVEIARVRVDHVTVYQSHLSSSGPRYIPLARATLT